MYNRFVPHRTGALFLKRSEMKDLDPLLIITPIVIQGFITLSSRFMPIFANAWPKETPKIKERAHQTEIDGGPGGKQGIGRKVPHWRGL